MRKAGAVLRDVLLLRSRYPAIRSGPANRRKPVAALADLGLNESALREHEREYGELSRPLFEQLLFRGREGGLHPELVAKLEGGMLPEHEGMKLLYLGIRAARPATVVETGTFAGIASTIVLSALEENGTGRLVSLDLPALEPIEHAVDAALPPGREPGWLIPDDLRGRLELVLGDARRTLPPVLARLGSIDVFFHDSLHTTRHMLFEYRHAWRALAPGGLLLTDDVFMTPAFWAFAQAKRTPWRHTGTFGVVRKPVRAA